jgi:hypothetical protein
MEKFICKFCGKEFDSPCKLGGHVIHCKLNPNYEKNLKICTNNINKHNCKKEKDNTIYYCKFCNKPCVGKNSLVQHEIRCKENPDKIKRRCNFNYPGKVIWNKGLTKETDERVKKQSETAKQKYKDGENKVWCDGLTKETDERIKNSSIKIQNTIDKKIKDNNWHNSHNLTYLYKDFKFDSYWEVLFVQFLDKYNILWVRNTNDSFEYTYKNSPHKYYPDFYLPDYDLYIEIKGYFSEKDINKWEQFTKNIDIYDSKDLYDLQIIESFDKRNLIPDKFREKHLDLSSFL